MKNYDIVNDSESLEKAIARAKKAQKEFAKYSQEEVDKIFFKAALAAVFSTVLYISSTFIRQH